MVEFQYDALMQAEEPHIVLNLGLERPAELTDFLGAFLSLSSQYDGYMRREHRDIAPESKIFVKEIRPGSIEAILIPSLPLIIDHMDKALIVERFVKFYGTRLAAYFQKGGRDKEAKKGDLKDLMDAVSVIANDPNGRAMISAVDFSQGKTVTKASIKFDTSQAKIARESIASHKKELDQISAADHQRVLMWFKRSDKDSVTLGVRSGERVVIEDIADDDLPLIYASDLSEERIKHEIRATDENIYYKGFVVDVNVQMRGGRPVAYAVTHIHQVIDLPNEGPDTPSL